MIGVDPQKGKEGALLRCHLPVQKISKHIEHMLRVIALDFLSQVTHTGPIRCVGKVTLRPGWCVRSVAQVCWHPIICAIKWLPRENTTTRDAAITLSGPGGHATTVRSRRGSRCFRAVPFVKPMHAGVTCRPFLMSISTATFSLGPEVTKMPFSSEGQVMHVRAKHDSTCSCNDWSMKSDSKEEPSFSLHRSYHIPQPQQSHTREL